MRPIGQAGVWSQGRKAIFPSVTAYRLALGPKNKKRLTVTQIGLASPLGKLPSDMALAPYRTHYSKHLLRWVPGVLISP